MRQGKLTNEQLSEIVLSELKPARDDVVLRPGVGVDCGAVIFGDQLCVVSTDPITVKTAGAGALAVQVSINDVAASGAEPVAALLTILAPPDVDISEIAAIVQDAQLMARKENIEIIGGHTEVTDAVNRIVLSVTALGKIASDKLIRAENAKEGDDIVMTKYAAIEGTRIMMGDDAPFSEDMLSVSKEARIASAFGASAMHDATEGGVLGAAWEIAQAGGLGVHIYADEIPVHPATARACAERGMDPLRLIASGSMIIAHPKGEALCAELEKHGVKATVIGRLVSGESRITLAGKTLPLAPPEADEIYKL
ncbi:MAG: AIR synthase family protein [Christensenellales bacterium]|jgi:hydrogenase expression/formation protein HypE